MISTKCSIARKYRLREATMRMVVCNVPNGKTLAIWDCINLCKNDEA